MKIQLTKVFLWGRLGQIGPKRSLMSFVYAISRTVEHRQRASRLRGNGSACGGRKSPGDCAIALAASRNEPLVCLAGSPAASLGINDIGRIVQGAGESGKRSIHTRITGACVRAAVVFFGFAVSDGQARSAGFAQRRVLSTGTLRRGGAGGQWDAGGGLESITVGGPKGERTVHPD